MRFIEKHFTETHSRLFVLESIRECYFHSDESIDVGVVRLEDCSNAAGTASFLISHLLSMASIDELISNQLNP